MPRQWKQHGNNNYIFGGDSNRDTPARAGMACVLCARAKKKCSGEVPCARCVESGLRCEYQPRRTSSGRKVAPSFGQQSRPPPLEQSAGVPQNSNYDMRLHGAPRAAELNRGETTGLDSCIDPALGFDRPRDQQDKTSGPSIPQMLQPLRTSVQQANEPDRRGSFASGGWSLPPLSDLLASVPPSSDTTSKASSVVSHPSPVSVRSTEVRTNTTLFQPSSQELATILRQCHLDRGTGYHLPDHLLHQNPFTGQISLASQAVDGLVRHLQQLPSMHASPAYLQRPLDTSDPDSTMSQDEEPQYISTAQAYAHALDMLHKTGRDELLSAKARQDVQTALSTRDSINTNEIR